VITKAIIVLGASAGGVEALVRLCQEFPADFAGTMFIAQHIFAVIGERASAIA
jgi:two-component system chemotaxis response regulator CheB